MIKTKQQNQIFGPQLEEKLRQCAEDIINEVDILEASIDGKNITNFEKFRDTESIIYDYYS